MTPEEFAAKMQDAIDKARRSSVHNRYQYTDIEAAHAGMDEVMCELLRSLGYGAGVEVFENSDRWYA